MKPLHEILHEIGYMGYIPRGKNENACPRYCITERGRRSRTIVIRMLQDYFERQRDYSWSYARISKALREVEKQMPIDIGKA